MKYVPVMNVVLHSKSIGSPYGRIKKLNEIIYLFGAVG